MEFDTSTRQAFFTFLLRIADDRLILGHRLSEWCGHGPILEEDIALGNIALDLLGQSSALLQLTAEIENNNRNEDDLTYLRDVIDFKNCKLVELPKGDFACTIARQFFFSVYSKLLFEQLQKSSSETLAGISSKAIKETSYHIRHSEQWMLRLGDGTEESHSRLQNAVNELWSYTNEMFFTDEVEKVLTEATLTYPLHASIFMHTGGKQGVHSEQLGFLLAELQYMQRVFPGSNW